MTSCAFHSVTLLMLAVEMLSFVLFYRAFSCSTDLNCLQNIFALLCTFWWTVFICVAYCQCFLPNNRHRKILTYRGCCCYVARFCGVIKNIMLHVWILCCIYVETLEQCFKNVTCATKATFHMVIHECFNCFIHLHIVAATFHGHWQSIHHL